MKGFWRFSVGTGTKEDKSSTGRVCAAEFRHVTARPRLARVLKILNSLCLWFYIFFRTAVNRGYWISEYGVTIVLKSLKLVFFKCEMKIEIYVYKPLRHKLKHNLHKSKRNHDLLENGQELTPKHVKAIINKHRHYATSGCLLRM
jgi:hypothetical protein